jgi:hypothetical protein
MFDVAACPIENRSPVGIQNEFATGEFGEITMFRVIRNIPLVENDAVPQGGKGSYEPSPESCVPVSPGGTDGQTEDD